MKKTTYDKKPITNIHPINGVTPKQLHDQCRYLITTFKVGLQLNSHEQMEAINNTVLYVYDKMEIGHLDKFDYQLFKGYLFMSLKTNCLQQIQRRNQVGNTFNTSFASIEDADTDDYVDDFNEVNFNIQIEQTETLDKLIMQLAPEKQAFLKDLLNYKGRIVQLCKKYGKHKSYFANITQELKLKYEKSLQPDTETKSEREYYAFIAKQPTAEGQKYQKWLTTSKLSTEEFYELDLKGQCKYLHDCGYLDKQIMKFLGLTKHQVNASIRRK